MTEKIKEALRMVKEARTEAAYGYIVDIEEVKQNIADILSNSYSERMRIYEAIREA